MIVQVQLLAILCDANAVDPLMQGSDIIAAQILDVLRLLLNLRMLEGEAVVSGGLILAPVVLSIINIHMV